jgi:hypothetical protein
MDKMAPHFPRHADSFRTGSPPVLFALPPQPVHRFFVPAFERVEDDDRFQLELPPTATVLDVKVLRLSTKP